MKPHRTDNVSLSFGTIFLLIAAWWAASKVVDLAPVRLGWLIAGALILFGMIGLLGAIRSGRRPPEPVPATVGAPVEEQHGDLPPEMHAEIVRELLDDPADRFTRDHPAASRAAAASRPAPPVTSPAAPWPAPPAAPSPASPAAPSSAPSAAPSSAPPAAPSSAPPAAPSSEPHKD